MAFDNTIGSEIVDEKGKELKCWKEWEGEWKSRLTDEFPFVSSAWLGGFWPIPEANLWGDAVADWLWEETQQEQAQFEQSRSKTRKGTIP